MSRLVWGKTGFNKFRTGVDNVVLFVMDTSGAYQKGIAWSGVTKITENRTGGTPNELWADNKMYAKINTAEKLGLNLDAYMSPPEFDQCDGMSTYVKDGAKVNAQKRRPFGLAWRTMVGSDIDADAKDHYILKVAYGCQASPSQMNSQTINENNADAEMLSWDISTTPVSFGDGYNPSSYVEFDSKILGPTIMKKIEDAIYGTDDTESKLPTPEELKIILNG